MGNGTFTLTGTGNVWSCTTTTNFSLYPDNSTILINNTSATTVAFIGGGLVYNDITINRSGATGSVAISGTNQFRNFTDITSAAHSLLFSQGTTNVISHFNVNGSPGNLITLNSANGANAFNLIKSPSGLVNCDYLNIQHCIASPSTNTWYAGSNSVDNQAISTAGSGWIFTSMPPRKLASGGVG
jgi:hypothetical protein